MQEPRVLFVHANKGILRLVNIISGLFGPDIETASSLQEAVGKIRTYKPQLVFAGPADSFGYPYSITGPELCEQLGQEFNGQKPCLIGISTNPYEKGPWLEAGAERVEDIGVLGHPQNLGVVINNILSQDTKYERV